MSRQGKEGLQPSGNEPWIINDDSRTPMGKLAIMRIACDHPLKYQTRKENTPAASRMADT
jgi:hypothetical protein